MPKYKPLYSLYKGLRESKYDVPDSYVSFQKTLTQPGNAGTKSRRGLYQSLKESNYDVPDTYEDFYKNLFVPVNSTTSRALKIGENPNTPTVNRYRQKMFDSVDPNKNGLNNLSNRAVGQAVRATNNVRKPVIAKVVNQKGKPTGKEFAITPAKTAEDLDREYAQETTKNWENELHDQMADADKDAAKISDMFKSFIGSTDEVGSVWGNMTRGGGIAGTPHSVTTNNGILENTEARQILAAGDYNRKRRELLQLEQDSRNGAIFDNHSFFRGMYDAAKDTGLLTGGASDLINAGSLLATKQDLDNGVHTEAGDMLMQQAVKNSDAQSQYGDNQGWMYTGGVITTNMAPFMVQIGSAGFSKGMSNAIGKVVQGAASKVALGTMEKTTGMVGAHIANYIGKVTGLTTKAFGKAIQYGIVGAAQANTVGLGNVANDVINRYTGQVYQDEQGNYKFGTFDSDGKLVHEGGEDFLTALVKGDAAQTIEFATELAGGGIDAVGTALKNFVSKGGKKIINKYNMENVSKVVDFLLNNKVSKNARYLKAGADRTLGKVELNSIVGESLEEELGIIANTVFTGDNKISDLWDEKQQSQIWGGMLLSIGLMKGAVAPFHAYNAKQYYSYKHKLDKADVNLSQLLGKEKWEELRNQIDTTTNDDMPEMVNRINRDVALGKNRQPVREYIQNLLIMRGYDIGNMLAAKKAVEDKGEGVSVKNMEKNQAYQQGRDAYGYDTHEIQLDQEDKQKSLAQLIGISEQQLASMSDEELEALSGRDDNIDRAIYDYQLSTARYEGVIDNARDQIDLEVQRAAQAVDMYTDKSSNTIRNATIKATGGLEDYGVYIINGNIATHEDGSIDISNSDDMILYYDPTTNTVEHADATMFAELGSEENADEVRSQAMADAKEKAIKETTGIIDGVVEVGTQFKTVDADGTEHTYEVLADNGDGTAVVTIDGNVPTELVNGESVNIPVSFEELQKMKDEYDQQRLQAAKAEREQMEKERAAKQTQETEQTQPSFDFNQILNDNGNVVLVDVLDEDGNTKYPNSKLFLIRDAGAKAKVVELKSDGTIVPHAVNKEDVATISSMSLDEYKQAMPESSMIEENSGENIGEIEVETPTIEGEVAAPDNEVSAPESAETPATEQTPAAPAITLEDGTIVPMLEDGNPDFSKLTAEQTAELYDTQFGEDADSIVSGYVSDAKKALDKAINMTVKGKTFVEQKAAKDAKEKAIADAQAAYDSAIAIRDAYNERQLAKVEDTAEGRKELIEKARRKFARLKSAVKDDAEAVAQLYKETIGSLLHRLYDGTGIDVTDTTPLTAEEYVASNLGAHSLNYEGTETSKGVKQETGLSREDFAKTQLLAADGKGTTIDALVHSLWENRPSNLESLDTQDIRNALIGVLNSGFKASEARNFVENIRIAQAENILEEQKRAQENAAYAEQHKAEPEAELKAKSDEKAELKAKPEEKLDNESSNESNDLGNDLDNEKTNDKINDNINAPEVPEDATDENPLGLQLSEDKVPFEIEGGKSGETYDINDNEDRQRLINDNKVDDKDILDIDMPKHVHKAIKELCKKMGLKVQFLYMGARSNGWIENGTMYLALDTEKATQFVFGHEMTHAIKQKNPEAYKELVKVAMAVTTKKKFEEDLAKVYQNYHGISGYNNVDDYVEEVVADNLGKFINDFDLAQKFSLRLNHPILGTILHAIQKIKSLLYGDFYKSVDALERIVEKAYVETAKGEVTNSETGEDVSFSLRQKPEPKKKGVGYKVFVLKDGKLYPPMVANPDGAATPVGVWLDADAAPIAGESKTGRPQVKQGGNGTQGGSGKLAYRPGWHLGVVPYAIQFNRKDAEGNKTLFPKNFVFAEVEYAADVDYQEEARQEGINPSGKYQHSLAGLKHLPTDGYYMYRTNPNPETDPWVITGAMKVNRILTRAEQAELVKNAGREPQQIQEGDIVTDDVVNSINQEIADAPKFSLKVYHGSGADFTEFDFDHMGEGAGSQAFGWGGYVTSSEKIGKSYAGLTIKNRYPSEYDTAQKQYTLSHVETFILEGSDKNEAIQKVKGLYNESLDKIEHEHPENNYAISNLKERIETLDEMEKGKLPIPTMSLYEVDIPDDNGSNYIEFYKDATPEFKEKIKSVLANGLPSELKEMPEYKEAERKFYDENGTDESFEKSLIDDALFELERRKSNGDAYNALSVAVGDKLASKILSSLGYTGIKYPAGTIMGGVEGDETNYVIFKPEDMKITEHTKFSIKTYHGSQASFDKFDHSFMGSGEGAQAYGWGTYVSEVEGIAKAYAKQNAARHGMPREYKIAQLHLNHAKYEYDKVQRAYDNSKAYIDSLKEDLQNYRESIDRRKEKVAYFAQNNMPEAVDKLLKQIKRTEDTIKVTENDINMRTNDLEGWKPKLEEVKKKYEEEQKKFDAIPKPQIERNLYYVDIPDDNGENYIGWDEKMTPRMRDIRKEILEDNGYKLVDSDGTRDYFEDRDGKEYDLFKEKYKTGGTFYEELAQLLHSQKLASLALKEYGFDGVKVIAERNTGGNKEGKMNYVIFDENNAQITSHTKFSLRLKSAIDETETNPSDAQKESGNYKKGHIKFGGYDYTIENPKGSTRSGKDADGKEWRVTMHDTYGYIRGKFGKDGDHLDMFINDKADLDNWNGDVFVVDQVNPDGSFDEHKVMYGYDSMDDAKKAYLANYSDGWQGLGNITGASKDKFDKWLDTSNRKLKPFADYAKVKFSLKSKPVRFEAGKELSDEEKKEVLSTLKDAYKVNGVPYHIEETAGGKEKRVYEPTADSYVVSDITNRPLRYYITLPDGRVAHPTEVYPNISDNEVKSSATKQGLLDDEADTIISAAIGNMKDIADNAKAVEVLTELQNLPHETHDVGYGLNNAQSYNYKTGIFTSDAAQAIDYVVRRMRRKEDVPTEIPAALKKAVADSYGMVDNLIGGMSTTKFSLKKVNDDFNQRLEELVKNPNQKDKILRLGRSSSFLKVGGITDAEIELDFDKFIRKSGDKYKNNHPFAASDLINLPMALAEPIAVFNSTTANDHVVLTELQKDGKNFIVAVRAVEQHRKGGVVLEVNKITSLYPKEERGIVYWINNGRISNVDKEKALHFIEALQPHAGTTITDEELKSAANIINSFETTKGNGEKVDVEAPKTFEEFLNHPSLKFSIKNEQQRKAAEDAYEYASKLRPNKSSQYALVDMSNPSNSPEYYEKKVLADRWRRFYNKAVHNELDDVYKDAWGNYKLFDLDRPFADQVNEVKGDVPNEFNAPDVVANKNADNESGAEYHEYKQDEPSSITYKDRYKAFKQREANREKTAGLRKERKEVEDVYKSKSEERVEYNKQLMKEYMDEHGLSSENDIPYDVWDNLRSKSFEKYQDELDSLFNKYKDLDKQIKAVAEPRFSLKDEKTLAGVHNITEEKLRKALKLGGFANPSLAVIDTNKSGHNNFGEISFIAPSVLLDKRTGKTGGTWITDAYTQRYPSVERQMSEKGSQKFEDWVDSLEYPSAAKAEIKRQTKDVLEDNGVPAWELMYLKEKGIDIKAYDSNVDYRWKEIINDHPTAEDILSSMQNDPELNEKVTSLAKHAIIYPTWEKISLEVRRKMYEETGVKASPINPQVRKQTKEIFERDYKSTLLNKDGSPRKKDVKKVVEDIVKEHNDTKKYDFYLSKVKASNYVNKNGLYDDYIRWQENKLDEFGTKNRIFRGYTRDGSRKYVPETLENVSKAMREEADGQTNGSEYTSFGSFIAKLASRVDSTDEMRANKDKLSSNKDKEEFYEKWSEVYYDLAKFLYNDVFYGEQRLHDIVLQSDPKKYAKKEYGITLTPTFMKKLDALKNAVQTELKSAYFETKYNRPLRLNEFAAAVVPDNLGEDVRKGIENAGLPMYNYDPNKEGDRSRAFNEAINSSDNIRFSLKAMMEKPEGWKQANKKAIHIAEAIERDPKFSLKNLDGTLIKAGTYFSGGGLVEEGLKGIIDPVVAVEYDEKISGVYRNNFGQHIVTADVRDVDPRELVKHIDGEVEYFHASPVCKNYSQAKSNHAEVELDKETADSTAEFINAIKPKVVTIENVKGYKDSEAMKIITDAMDANGYTWDADVYNAADYGGYTHRERLIVRAVRDGKLPEKPKKMAHKSGWYEAVADIIPTLTEKKNGVAPWMDIRLKADGIDWRNIDKPLYVMGSAYADGKVPHAFADELLPTLRTKSGDVIVMPDGKVYRAMGRVLARVSGVSDDYKMPFSENLSHTIIGNGIPTQLTEHVIAPLLTGSDPKFSLKKINNVKDSRIIPTDVDKSVSSQIEKKYDSAIKEVMNKVAERDKRLVSNYIEQDLSDFSKMRREDINQELKSNENWRRKNLREENREGSTYGITDARHRITEATAERELEYRDARAKYLSETYGLQGGRQTSLDMVDRAFEDTLGNETNRGELRELYGRARKILVQVGAEFGGVDNAKQEGDLGFAGTDRDISLFIDTMTRTSTPQSELAHTILHEMIHQATIGSINLVKKGMADGMLTPKQIEAVNTIINTYDAYKADRRLVWEEDNYRDYGGKDEYEFAAEMADAKQRRILSIPYGERILNAANELKRVGDISLWQAIKNALRKLFEVSDKSKMDKALSDIMDDFNKNIDDISMNNIEQTDFGLNGNTRFSLRYDQFEHDLNQWKKDNNLPKDAQRPTIPQRNAGESAVDFLRRVDEYRKQMALWKTAPTYEQHLLSDDTALGEFNRELQRGSVLKRIAFQDSMLAIRKAQEAIMKEVGVDRLNMAEDAYTAENRSHGKGKNEFEEYNNEFLQPLRKAYHQMKNVLGDSYDNVRIYMMAKHGLERDAQMAFKKSLEADYEDVAQRSAAYKAYKGDMNRIINDSDLEFGRVDFTTWRQRDNALRVKYSPSYMDYRYDKNGIAYDYSGLSALFDGSDFEEAAHKLVKDIESKYVAETHDLWDATNAATKKILRDGYKAGMMSKDTYQYVRDMYSYYIPLRGWDGTTADQVWDYIGGGKGAFNQTLKKAHGRTSIADDPIAYIENMAESGILLNNKNWVKQHLMLLAQNHPTSLLTLSKAWYVKSTDANGNEEWIPATPQITSQMDSNQVKAAIDAFEKKMEKMAQTGDATQKRDGLNIAYPQTNSEEREHEVRVMKDGEEYVIYVNGDPQLAQAMNNTRAHRVREGIKNSISKRVIAVVGRKMAAAYTSLSPLFIPSNYFRDLTMTLASTAIREDAKYNYLLGKNLATSWNLGFMLKDYQNGKLREKVSNGNATPKEQMFYDFMMNGGETGFVSSLDVEDLKKKFKNDLKDLDRWKANPVKIGHTIMDCIEFLNRMIEDSNRFAIYMTSIQYGRSIDEAVNDAKDVTLNFNRKGTGEHSWQTIRNLYLFINPAVQSLQTLGALAKHHPFKFTAVTASWLASGVLVPIVNVALMQLGAAFCGGDGDDKDWYKDISKKYWQFTKWDRRNNFIMWVPTTYEFVKIPLAQEFRAFYGLGDMIASKMMGGELAEESWEDYGWDLVGQVVDMLPLDPTGYDGNIEVSLMPNPIRPVFELAFNVDFTGKPLFKDTEYNKYDPNFTKAYVGTPDWLVRASRMMNSIGNDYPDVQQNKWDALGNPRYNLNNPAVVDHVLSSYLGGAYTMGSQVLGLLTKSLNDRKEIKVADIPLVSKFVSNPDDRPVSKKQGDEFWDKKEYYDRASNTISKLKKQAKIDGDYSLLERFYGSEEYKTYKLYEKDVKDYKEARKKERAEESGDEYRPHQLNAEDIYNNHATPMDEFEDMKLKQLFEKLNSFKTRYDSIVDNAPNESDAYYNTNKAAIDAIDEISLDKQEISELKKGFLDDGKDAYNAEDMKQIRDLRKKILSVLEKANKVVVANQKAKAKK